MLWLISLNLLAFPLFLLLLPVQHSASFSCSFSPASSVLFLNVSFLVLLFPVVLSALYASLFQRFQQLFLSFYNSREAKYCPLQLPYSLLARCCFVSGFP